MRIGVTDGAAIVSVHERHALGSDGDLSDLAELVVTLLGGDTVAHEAALGIVEETEGLVGLLDADDI